MESILKKAPDKYVCMCLILFPSPRPTLDPMLCQIESKMQSNPIDFSEITCDSVQYICLSMCFTGYNRLKLFMTQISWTFTGTVSALKGRRKLVGKANKYRNVDGEVINISFLLYIYSHIHTNDSPLGTYTSWKFKLHTENRFMLQCTARNFQVYSWQEISIYYIERQHDGVYFAFYAKLPLIAMGIFYVWKGGRSCAFNSKQQW